MAYESTTDTVSDALKGSSATVFSDATIASILALSTRSDSKVTLTSAAPDANGNVTVAAGTEVVFIGSSDTTQTVIKPPTNAPVVIFQGRGGVVATLNDGVTQPGSNQTTPDRVVIGTAGNDRIIVADAKNTNVILGSGNSSVQTGAGVDTVQAGLGNSTIVGGSGDYAVVKLAGTASNYQVTTSNGHAIVTNQATGKTTDISKIQYVQLDNGNALVFAKDSTEGSVANLYQTAFGRSADAGGLDYWFDLAKNGASLQQIANAFANSAEFQTTHAGKSDVDFIQSLYQSTFNRTGEGAGVAYWQSALDSGASRADLIAAFAQIAIQNIQQIAPSQEAQVVGNVNIVTGII